MRHRPTAPPNVDELTIGQATWELAVALDKPLISYFWLWARVQNRTIKARRAHGDSGPWRIPRSELPAIAAMKGYALPASGSAHRSTASQTGQFANPQT